MSKGNYEYEEINSKLISVKYIYKKNLIKFKVEDKTFEFGIVSIETKKDNDKLVYLIFRNSMKTVLYQGNLFKNVSNF